MTPKAMPLLISGCRWRRSDFACSPTFVACAQVCAHLDCQSGDRAEAEKVRCVALIGAGEEYAVAVEERRLCLRAGAVGAAFEMTGEAGEGVGAAGAAAVYATGPWRVVDRAAPFGTMSPTVLRAKQVAEELVADDEERVDAQLAGLELHFVQGGVLDQLTGVARVEDAIEVLAPTQLDGFAQLFLQDMVVGNRRIVGRQAEAAGGLGARCSAGGSLQE
jgi:hypothetical protein